MGRQCRPYREHTSFAGENLQSAGEEHKKHWKGISYYDRELLA